MKPSHAWFGVLVGLSVFAFAGCGTPKQTATTSAPVSPWLKTVSGTVTITRNGTTSAAITYASLQPKDEIKTASSSQADIVWPGYGHTLLDANSDLVLSEAKNQTASINEQLTLTSGRVWTRLQKLLGPGSTFQVQSSDVILDVRGTSFGVRRDGDDVTVQVKESKVAAHRATGSEVLVQAGQETTVKPSSAEIPAPESMSSQELQDPFLIQGDRILSDQDLNADPTKIGTKTVVWNQPQACPQYGSPLNCYGNDDKKCGGYDNWSKTCATFVWNVNPCEKGQSVVGYTSATCSYDTGTIPQGNASATVMNGQLTVDCTDFAKQFKTEACTCNNGVTLHATVMCR